MAFQKRDQIGISFLNTFYIGLFKFKLVQVNIIFFEICIKYIILNAAYRVNLLTFRHLSLYYKLSYSFIQSVESIIQLGGMDLSLELFLFCNHFCAFTLDIQNNSCYFDTFFVVELFMSRIKARE